MHIRLAAFAVLAVAALGCHGSNYTPPPTAARTGMPPNPQETTSVSGSMRAPGENRSPSTTGTTTPNNAAAVPPPLAGTSTPTQGQESPPFKPGNEPPASVGGGPKPETGGAVFGDGNEGNTGAPKGGDGSAPGK